MGITIRKAVYELRDQVEHSKRVVYTHAQLAALFGYDREQIRVYAHRLVKKGFAFRPMEGAIAFSQDPYIIATQLVEPSYISFSSALYLHEILYQVPSIVECITTRNPRRLTELGIEYHKINPKLLFGYTRLERGKSYAFVAEPEKAILDSAYFSKDFEQMAVEALPRLNRGKLRRYAEAFSGLHYGKRVERWYHKHAEQR